MNAEEFLNELERRELLSEKAISKLRQQVVASKKPVPAEKIAELLVARGRLTEFQAQSVLDLIRETSDQMVEPPGDKPEVGDQRPLPAAAEEGEELGLAPGVEDELSPRAAKSPLPVFELEEDIEEEAAEEPAEDPVDVIAEAPPVAPPRAVTFDAFEDAAPVETPQETNVGQPRKESLLSDADTSSGTPTAMPRGRWGWLHRFRQRHGKTFRSKQWDSPLMLVGGGILAILILALIPLGLTVWRVPADELLQQAEDDYRSGAYTQSIAKYDKFLSRFSRHPKASLARVKRRMASLRDAAGNPGDLEGALDVANEILPEIKGEKSFPDVRPELAGLLPDIYAGFVSQAEAAENVDDAKRSIDAADRALALVNDSEYLPTSLRQGQQARIEAAQAAAKLVLREIDREQELAAASSRIRQAAEEGQTDDAWQIRSKLLQTYPGLVHNDALREAVRGITKKERELVRTTDAAIGPLREDHPVAIPTRVFIAQRQTEQTATDVEGHVVFVLVRGAVYGLDATTGRPLWRRYVGYETTFHPIPVSSQAGADAIVVDGRRKELLRLECRTGELVWRLPYEDRAVTPLMEDGRIWLAIDSGRLIPVDVATGEPAQAASFPQPLEVSPAVDAKRGRLYQLGQHSTLFVLSADTLACEEAYNLGHGAGSISVPPIVTAGHLIVAENPGVDFCLLHVIGTDESGLGLERRGEPIRLGGQMLTPPAVAGRRVYIATDRGAIHAFEMVPSDTQNPLHEIATTLGTAKQSLASYALVDRGQLWVGDIRLTKHEVHVARGELTQKWIKDDGDAFVAPLQRIRNVVFHVRHRRGGSGVTVSAIRIGSQPDSPDDGRRLWQTHLAAPLASDLTYNASSKQIVAVTSQGAVYTIDADTLRRGIADEPILSVNMGSQATSFRRGIRLDQGRYAFQSNLSPRRILVYSPGDATSPLRHVDLKIPSNERVGPMVAMGGSLLTPTGAGPVFLLDVDTGESVVHPFQPRLIPGATTDWQRPAVLSEQSRQFVIVDTTGPLYLVGLQEKPQPHLSIQAQNQLESNVVAPLAAIGTTCYAVVRNDTMDSVVSFQLPDLTLGQPLDLPGRAVWGPERYGDMVLLACDPGGLVCLGTNAEMRWNSPLEYGPLAGAPLVVDDTILLAAARGILWRIDADTGQLVDWTADPGEGEQSGWLDVGEPLGAGPVGAGRQLLLAGRDGTVFVTASPSPPRKIENQAANPARLGPPRRKSNVVLARPISGEP